MLCTARSTLHIDPVYQQSPQTGRAARFTLAADFNCLPLQMPGCGHTLKVPCHKAAAALADPASCTEVVEVAMPLCGHTVKVACGRRLRVLQDPATCTASCSGRHAGCEHGCTRTCGACIAGSMTGAGGLATGFLQHLQRRTVLGAVADLLLGPDTSGARLQQVLDAEVADGGALTAARWGAGRMHRQAA